MVGSLPEVPNIEELGALAEQKLGFRPCTVQLASTRSQLLRRHVFTIARTGFGKTLTFYLPLVITTDTIIILVTPLNILGDKDAVEVHEVCGQQVHGVNVTGDNCSKEVFKDIANLKYRLITSSPEQLVNNPAFHSLYQNNTFTSRLLNVTFDEAHSITQWGGQDFRPEYKLVMKLRWLLPDTVPFHFASATLPPYIFREITSLFNLSPSLIDVIRISNDRPNIHLQVVEMKHPKNSFHDLNRLFVFNANQPPPKFMVFTNKRKETEEIVKLWWKSLPPENRAKIVWFHSGMSDSFRATRMAALKKGELWGMVCTDAAGMGLDVPDIELVVQWGYVASLCTLMQRLGRAGRSLAVEARAVYFVENDYFDATITRKAAQAAARKEKRPPKQPKGDTKRRKVDEKTWIAPQCVPVGDCSSDSDGNDVEMTVASTNTPRSKVIPSWKGMAVDKYESLVMAAFINAKTRGYCYRSVSNAYFENHLAASYSCSCDHRCTPRPTRLCCDICNPSNFPLLEIPSLPSKKRGKNLLKLDSFTPSDRDMTFRKSLDEWCDRKMIEEGFGDEDFYGSQMILSEPLRERIVSLVHHHQLTSTEVLYEQTKWCYATRYGNEVLKLATPYQPSAFTQAPLARPPLGDLSTQPSSSKSNGPKCGACGQRGHIASNTSCPNWVLKSQKTRKDSSRTQKGYKENSNTTTAPSIPPISAAHPPPTPIPPVSLRASPTAGYPDHPPVFLPARDPPQPPPLQWISSSQGAEHEPWDQGPSTLPYELAGPPHVRWLVTNSAME